jgi:hypothetical protein
VKRAACPGFTAQAMAAEKCHHADTQLKAGMNQCGQSDNPEYSGVVHVYVLLSSAVIYTISGSKMSKRKAFLHKAIAFYANICYIKYISS